MATVLNEKPKIDLKGTKSPEEEGQRTEKRHNGARKSGRTGSQKGGKRDIHVKNNGKREKRNSANGQKQAGKKGAKLEGGKKSLKLLGRLWRKAEELDQSAGGKVAGKANCRNT